MPATYLVVEEEKKSQQMSLLRRVVVVLVAVHSLYGKETTWPLGLLCGEE